MRVAVPLCCAGSRDRAWIELDMAALGHNVRALQSLLPPGCQLMPAVKANAYGHGAIPITQELLRLGIRWFCVASVAEGIELRRRAIPGQILILGYTHPDQFPLLRRYRLTQAVVDAAYARQLNAYGKKLKVHVKIDTGMRRLGERADHLEALRQIFRCENLVVEGTFTHFCADETTSPADAAFTAAQAQAFYDTVAALEAEGFSCGKKHLLASYGLINYPQYAEDMVRIGIALYGVLSSRDPDLHCPIRLQPVLALKCRVASVRDLHDGEAAGYGLEYVAQGPRRLAALAIGYADGLPRALSCGVGRVLIHGQPAPLAGRICMDQTLVDVTGIPEVQGGDVAVVIGKDEDLEISAYDLAEQSGTITNEILSRLGRRLERIVV